MAIILGETGRNDVCLRLGKQGEHDVTFFEFDFSLWAAEYGDGVLSLRLTPNGSATAYPVTLDFDGTIATFTVTAADTATAGLGSAELVYIVGDDEKLKKSVSYVTSVEPSDDTGEAPEPYDEWLAHLEVLAGETSQAKTDAEQAASEAKASEQAAATSEQNAKTSEDNAEEYADRIADLTVSAHEATGETPTVIKTIVNDVYNLDFGLVPGKDGEDGKDGQDGADGVGIASVALNSDYTLTITLTDGTTYTTTSIRGEQGETGATPDFSIGTVTTLAPGSQATATITGTDEEPVLNLGIPKGDPGDVSSTGYYPDLYAGGLVTDKGDTDTAPYTFRVSKALGYRESLNSIVGATVAWNQLLPTISTEGWEAENASSISISGATIDATFSSGDPNVYLPAARPKIIVPFIAGHKYLGSVKFKSTKAGYPYYRSNAFGTSFPFSHALAEAGAWKTYETVAVATESTEARGYFGQGNANTVGLTYDDVVSFKGIMFFDLTQMFGSTIADYIYSLEQATAGAGVAWFKKLFPKPYYEYCQPSLESVRVSGHDVVGFNAWDEEWENGWIDANGNNRSSNSEIRSKNYIPVIPNTAYYFNVPKAVDVHYYDADKQGLGVFDKNGQGDITSTNPNKIRVTHDNCHYIRFWVYDTTTYNHDICINISDTNRNGEYEPYIKHSYPLDSDLVLRGIPKLDASNNLYYDGDMYEPDGTVTRKYGIIDLGTLTWTKGNRNNDDTGYIFRSNFSSIAISSVAVCSKYTLQTTGTFSWEIIKKGNFGVSGTYLLFADEYASEADFKTAMDGVYLIYELATPTTETADTYQQIQVCDPDGTEAFVDYGVASGDRDVAIPVGHETFYPEDLKGKLEDIPDIPEAPASNGTYTLKAVRSNTGVVYSWVSG